MGKVKVSRRTAVKAVVYLAILLLQFDCCKSSSPVPVVGTVNGNVTLSLSNVGPFTEIMWKKGKNKVIELDSGEVKTYPPFDGRVHLDNTSGDLHISNLTSLDEGEYEVEIPPSSKNFKFNLTVFDPLPSPILLCALDNESIEFQCYVPENYGSHRGELAYSWHCSLPQCGESRTQELRFKKNGDLQGTVQCSVANPESNRTSSEVLSACVPAGNSRHRYLLILTLAIIVLAVCIVVIYCRKYSRRAGSTTSS